MKYRIFWTCILPEHLIAKHGLSFAACNFSFNLMGGGVFDKVYSSMPLFVGGEMQKDAFDDKRFELIYDKWRYKSRIWQKLATFKEQLTIFKRIPKGASVWFYNLNTINALLFILLKLLKPSVQLNVIVLDFTPVQSGLGLNRIYLKLINAAHGRICLAHSPLFKKNNSAILPGVVPQGETEWPIVQETRPTFLLSGVLSPEISMLQMVLEAFAQMPECELHITGSKGDEMMLQQYSTTYPNIIWHGQLPFADYLNLMHRMTFQLSTRDATSPENQCNFPSKIIEALFHNRIVVSTITYPQIEGVNYFKVHDGKEGFINDIRTIVATPQTKLMTYANQGERVKHMFGINVWKQAMERIEM